jgi:hypothetical protein
MLPRLDNSINIRPTTSWAASPCLELISLSLPEAREMHNVHKIFRRLDINQSRIERNSGS